MRAALTSVARVLRPGVLVILQSTTYPGTTVEVCRPELEASGLTAGVDFHLAFSPERVDPGNARWTVATTPKVVGGLTAECGRRASVVLESFMDAPGLVRQVSTPHAAEMAKLLENTYRAVNIALVNELAQLCHRMGIDVWEVIDAAATKPFGFEAFRPGIGPGGHCIPVDPQYLSWKAREFDFRTEFIDLAADTNLTMADYVLGRIRAFADRQGVALAGARVLCLGVAFKPGVSDTRNSRAIRVIELLLQAGAHVEFADPHVAELEIEGQRRKAVAASPTMANGFDLVVVLVAHPEWKALEGLSDAAPVFDAVGAIEARGHPAYERLVKTAALSPLGLGAGASDPRGVPARSGGSRRRRHRHLPRARRHDVPGRPFLLHSRRRQGQRCVGAMDAVRARVVRQHGDIPVAAHGGVLGHGLVGARRAAARRGRRRGRGGAHDSGRCPGAPCPVGDRRRDRDGDASVGRALVVADAQGCVRLVRRRRARSRACASSRGRGQRFAAVGAGIVVLLFALSHLRDQSFVIAVWALAVALLLGSGTDWPRRALFGVAVLLVLPAVLGYGLGGIPWIKDASPEVEVRRTGNAVGASTALTCDATKGGISGKIEHLPCGLPAVVLRPYPWETDGSTSVRLARLEALLWYPLLILSIYGLFRGWSRRRWLGFPALYAGAIVLVYALTEGNIGTAFRHRAEAVWAVALFAALGAQTIADRRARSGGRGRARAHRYARRLTWSLSTTRSRRASSPGRCPLGAR